MSLTDVTVSAVVNQMFVIGGVADWTHQHLLRTPFDNYCNCAMGGGGGVFASLVIPLRPMALVSSAIVEQFFVVAVSGPFPPPSSGAGSQFPPRSDGRVDIPAQKYGFVCFCNDRGRHREDSLYHRQKMEPSAMTMKRASGIL